MCSAQRASTVPTSERADGHGAEFTWVLDLQPHLTVSPVTTTGVGVGRRENTSGHRYHDLVRESAALLDLPP